MSTKFKSGLQCYSGANGQNRSQRLQPNHVAKEKWIYCIKASNAMVMQLFVFLDQSRDKYVIVDGFHRYTIMLRYKNIFERENGMLPVSVMKKTSVIEWHPPFDTTERENTRWNYKLH
jgi:hypothetical protein